MNNLYKEFNMSDEQNDRFFNESDSAGLEESVKDIINPAENKRGPFKQSGGAREGAHKTKETDSGNGVDNTHNVAKGEVDKPGGQENNTEKRENYIFKNDANDPSGVTISPVLDGKYGVSLFSELSKFGDGIIVPPGQCRTIRTGYCIELKDECGAKAVLADKFIGKCTIVSSDLFTPDYKDDLKFTIYNYSRENVEIKNKEKIVKLVIIKIIPA
jgi:dUTPase